MNYYRNHTQNIANSTFINSTVVGGDHNVGTPPDVAELRQLLRDHRSELVRLAGPRGARVDSRIEEIEEEIETTEPRASTVRSAWESVLNVLKGGAAAAESVAKITDAIGSLFAT